MPKQNNSVSSGRVRRLKQEAKKYKKTHGTTQADALDSVAKNHGFPNWKAVVKAEKESNAIAVTTPPVSLNFVADSDIKLSATEEKVLASERGTDELSDSKKILVSKNRALLASVGAEYSLFEPTKTGLSKSILDATKVVATHFRMMKFHDYDAQGQGEDFKVVKSAVLLTPDAKIETKVSLYRPETKKGDPRMWFPKLPKFAAAGDQIAIVLDSDIAFLLNISSTDLSNCLESDNFIATFLLSFGTTKSGVANELITKLTMLAKEPLKAVGVGDKTIGMTIEAALGISANSSKEPDYKGIEIKSGKGNKTRSNLFAQVADWKRSGCKSSREILEKYGYPRGDDFKLYCTVRVNQKNSQGLMFQLDEKNDDLIELDSNGESVAIWPGELLRSRLKEKHSETFWVQADVIDVEGEQCFLLKSVVHTKSPLLSQLMPLIGSGVITMDHLIKRKGGEKGRVSEKGPLFKIDKKNLELLFPKPKKYLFNRK